MPCRERSARLFVRSGPVGQAWPQGLEPSSSIAARHPWAQTSYILAGLTAECDRLPTIIDACNRLGVPGLSLIQLAAAGTAELPELELCSAQQRERDPEGECDDVEDQSKNHHDGIYDGREHVRHLPSGRNLCLIWAGTNPHDGVPIPRPGLSLGWRCGLLRA
jgi:hypothetical protein